MNMEFLSFGSKAIANTALSLSLMLRKILDHLSFFPDLSYKPSAVPAYALPGMSGSTAIAYIKFSVLLNDKISDHDFPLSTDVYMVFFEAAYIMSGFAGLTSSK